ncbi:Cytochrome P, partial [Parasponia andersonii]
MNYLQGYDILFLVWLVSTILVRAILTKSRTKARLLPSPFALPIIGHPHLLADLTFAPYGTYWKFMKKLCMPQLLLGGQTQNQLLPIRSDEINRLLKVLVERVESKESVDIGRELTKLISNVVLRMVMNKRSCAENDDEADEDMNVINGSTE